MKTSMGEYLVGAYLKRRLGCDVVDYNVRPSSTGLPGLAEFDVVGLNFASSTAYVCEVITHLDGINYGNNQTTVQKIKEKFERQQRYAQTDLVGFKNIHFMLWAPVVPRGYLTRELARIEGLELQINEEYEKCVDELRREARSTTRDTGNPFFRALQILERLRG